MAARLISRAHRPGWTRYLISLIVWFCIATACVALLTVLDKFLVVSIAMVGGGLYDRIVRAIGKILS